MNKIILEFYIEILSVFLPIDYEYAKTFNFKIQEICKLLLKEYVKDNLTSQVLSNFINSVSLIFIPKVEIIVP